MISRANMNFEIYLSFIKTFSSHFNPCYIASIDYTYVFWREKIHVFLAPRRSLNENFRREKLSLIVCLRPCPNSVHELRYKGKQSIRFRRKRSKKSWEHTDCFISTSYLPSRKRFYSITPFCELNILHVNIIVQSSNSSNHGSKLEQAAHFSRIYNEELFSCSFTNCINSSNC